jgi:hypothetical protein
MPAPSNGDLEIQHARQLYRIDYVSDAMAARNQQRTFVN